MTVMEGYGVWAVDECRKLMVEMLGEAQKIKKTITVEPPLNKSDLAESLEQILSVFPPSSSVEFKKHVIETAVREIFYNLLATSPIESASFVRVWNLFDIISILCDDGHTESALLFWLVEELLDSQTISGCRKIFDYLESRKERLTAKHFPAKNLVILRTCNELLRRLSRAEDTAFCGRVFIFLFQSFPLGDRSSVNLRGEYHTENVTTFGDVPPRETPVAMEVDSDANANLSTPESKATNGDGKKPSEDATTAKGVSFKKEKVEPLSTDELYPIFWSLQQTFSQPKRLFDTKHPEYFASFKSGLEATMTKFKSIQPESSGRVSGPSLPVEEKDKDGKRGMKRRLEDSSDDRDTDFKKQKLAAPSMEKDEDSEKQEQTLADDAALANAFNPKYLTSYDLFDLELADLSFRRHILVQVLIIMEFLLSLSINAKAKLMKSKLPDNPNKSVMYADWTLSEEDTKWALHTRMDVAEYLKNDHDGILYYRMIETVLLRDKNWARWKIANCPSIARPPVSSDNYAKAMKLAKDVAKPFRKMKEQTNLDFLQKDNSIDKLKGVNRYETDRLEQYKARIENSRRDIDAAMDDADREKATQLHACDKWRALRIASATKLASFDKIESFDKIDTIFNQDPEPTTNTEDDQEQETMATTSTGRLPVIISGPSGVGKGTLINKLMENHPEVFGKKASHTTRAPREGEVDGTHYYFINKEKYDIMRDGDKFLEFNNFNGNDYGTSREVVDAIIAQGKIPVMEMDYHGIQQLKDQGYASRFIFIDTPSIETLKRRLKGRGTDSPDKIEQRLKIAVEEIEQSKVPDFHDKIIVNDHLETTCKELEDYMFAREGGAEATSSTDAIKEGVNGAVEEEKVENGHATPVDAEVVIENGAE